MTEKSEICAVVLAAGEGRRLRPLTELLPKALCPVGNVPLLDRALARIEATGLETAVNAAYLADKIVRHVDGRAHVSVEPDGPLGTAGGLARLRKWIDGRGVLAGNADGYLAGSGADISVLLEGWSGTTVRLLTKPVLPGQTGGFSGRRFAGFSLLPWHLVRDLPDEHGELVGRIWRPAEAAGILELIPFDGVYIDTGTPRDYLAANLHAAGGGSLIDSTAQISAEVIQSVVGAHCRVQGSVIHSVLWPGAAVSPTESLTSVIRAPSGLTVQV